MKRVILPLLFLSIAATEVSAQFYYQDANNVDMIRHARQTGAVRREIILPQVNGYNVYKADLHTHTIYSDGDCTPEYRVKEAWNNGLDVLAITEHIEYRKHEGNMIAFLKGYVKPDAQAVNYNIIRKAADEKGIQSDLNLAVKLAQKAAKGYGITIIPGAEITREPITIGHYNALFTQDNNTLYDTDPMKSFVNARKQGALIMHNHPGWRRKSLEHPELEKTIYEKGFIDGIEIMNGSEFYPKAITRAHEQKLFVSANTDVHNSTYEQYILNNCFRNMTFIFAKENTLEALKEALVNRRTLAYAYGSLAGEEQLLKDFFQASVSYKVISEGKNGKKNIVMTNLSSMTYLLRFGNGNPILLEPFSSLKRTTGEGGALSFTVENLWQSENEHPKLELNL